MLVIAALASSSYVAGPVARGAVRTAEPMMAVRTAHAPLPTPACFARAGSLRLALLANGALLWNLLLLLS